jgi:hypothetical protein
LSAIKRKRREWIELVPGLPARAAILRPTRRRLARMRLYLHTKNACPEAIEAAAGARKRYLSWRHKQKSAVADAK